MAKTGRNCTVCAHKARHQIEIGLVHRVPARVLALRFGLGKHAISRHGKNHLSPAQRAAILSAQKPTAIDLDALQASESEGLLAQLVAQRARLQSHVELAADLGDVRGVVAAEGAITNNLTLVAKLLGQLVQRHEVRSTNLLVSPDYIRLRHSLVEALKPYPEAARAVGAALHRLESEAADVMAGGTAKTIEHASPAPTQHVIPPPPC